MLDPIQYEFRFFQNTLSDPEPEREPEPEPKLRYSGSSSGQKFRGSGSATLGGGNEPLFIVIRNR